MGLAVLLGVLSACALTAERTVWALGPELAGAPRALALMTTGSAALLACVIVPGALGLLRPLAILITAGLLAAAVVRLTRGRDERFPVPWHGEREPLDAWLLPGAAAVLVAGCALALVRDVTGAPISSIDAQNFQVPIPARWIQQHSVWGLHQFIPDYSNATYPHHGNALIALVMSPFESPFLARLVAVPFWAMAAVAVYAMGREIGGPRPACVAAAACFAALPVSIRAGLEGAQTDMPMLAWLGAGGLFLLRHHRTGRTGELVLAGLGLGLALGTKWYALTTIAVVVTIWAVARAAGGVAPRRVLADGAKLLGVIAAASGFWLLRNWIETGNPLFPQPVGPIFDAPPDPLRERGGFTIAHYLFDGDVWTDYLWPAFRISFGLAGAALAACAIAGARRAPVLAIASLALVAVYFVTPYSAFGPEGAPVLAAASTRYALPALMAAAVVATRVPGAPVLLSIGALAGVRRGFDLSAGKVLLGVAGIGLLVAFSRATRSRPAAAVWLATAAIIVTVLVAAHRANDQGYGPLDPTLAYIEAKAPTGHDIGLAGIWSPQGVSPVLPAFGKRLGNEVAYVGRFEDGMLRAYSDEAAFARAARTHDLVIVGREDPQAEDWTRMAGFGLVAESPRLALYARAISSP